MDGAQLDLDVQNDFASRLRQVRLSYGISQTVLAEALGVGQTYAAKWEAAAYKPSEQVRKRIAGFFQVSERWLAQGTSPVYQGLIFVPLRMYLTKYGFNRKALLQTVRFVMDDGAHTTVLVVSEGDQGDGMFLFSREDELFLFLPFRSPAISRGQSSSAKEMWALLEESRNIVLRDGTIAGPVGDSTARICVLSETDFGLLAPSTPLPVLEGLLSVCLPEGLKVVFDTDGRKGSDESRILMKLLEVDADEASSESLIDGFLADFMKRMEDERTLRTVLALSPLLKAKLGVDNEGVVSLPEEELRKRIARMGEKFPVKHFDPRG
jgi:transcriptional regulator with XRE-family HTH domain